MRGSDVVAAVVVGAILVLTALDLMTPMAPFHAAVLLAYGGFCAFLSYRAGRKNGDRS